MRRLPMIVSVLVGAPAIAIIAPVVSRPVSQARPVAPVVSHIALPVILDRSVPMLAPAAAVAAIAAQGTAQFRMVGISWRHDPQIVGLSAQVRVRTDGVWTPWQVDEDTDLGADGVSSDAQRRTRDATEPLWVGHANGVEVRVTSVTGPTPVDLRVDLIDPGTSPADSDGSAASALDSAAAATSQPAIITRAMWGADESLRTTACPSGPQYTGTPQVAFIHHTATTNSYGPADSAAIVRSIYAYHVLGDGWCDIGYNFLVDRYGQIFEGRFGGVDKAVLGAHTGGFNTDSFGVAMIGTFNSVAPTPQLQNSLAQLLAWKLGLSYANPIGRATLHAADFSESNFAAGTDVAFNVISGHRDADSTDCPGTLGYAMLPALRQQVLQDMGEGLVHPSATVSGRTASANGNVHLTAGLLTSGTWQLTVQDATGAAVRTITGSGAGIDTSWDMTSDAQTPVAPGVYVLTLSSTGNGVSALPWSTSVTVGGVFGSIDPAVPTYEKIAITGWALRGVDTGTASVRVTVSSADAGTFVANQPRPDAAALYPAYGDGHGFTATVATTAGFHTVCVYGVNSDLGLPDSLLGCQGVTVPDVLLGPFTRLAGADRFGTAVAIGQTAAASSTTVVIASGLAMPDAVAAGPLAVHLGAPVLLTTANTLPPALAADIAARHATTAYLVGGTAVISAGVVTALQAAGVTNVIRLGGSNRFETAALVAAHMGATQSAVVVDGDNAHLIDGFTIGGIAGHLGQPILLATSTGVPAVTAAELTTLGVTTTTVVGGSIPPSVVATLPGGQSIFGADRYATSVAVATKFAAALGAGVTVLANGVGSFPVDALSAASLGRPTLLVSSSSVPDSVETWLSTNTMTTAVTAVGGIGVISDLVAGAAAGDALIGTMAIPAT